MRVLAFDLLRSRRVMTMGVSAGLLLVSIGYLALYPSFEEQLQNFADDLPDAYSAVLGDVDIASPEGYIRSQVYSLLAPLLIAGAAIAAGASLARAERDKTLAVFAMLPVSRRQLAGGWWLHMAIIVAVCSAVTIAGVVIGAPLAGTDVGVDRIVLATAPMALFALFVGGVAMLASAVLGSPGAATGLGWVSVVVTFVLNSLSELIDGLSWLGSISPWSWHGAGQAITGDFDWQSFLLLMGASAIVGLAATHRFVGRNLHI